MILDWMMPGGGGAKAAAAISASLPSTRIVGDHRRRCDDGLVRDGHSGCRRVPRRRASSAAELVEAIRQRDALVADARR